jgi:ribokinase
MKPIVVVGSINMDLVVRTARIPRPGQTVLGRDFRTFPGGKGANQAVGVAKLGYAVAMVGKLGRDSFGDELFARLGAEGVGREAIQRVAIQSGVAFITLDEGGENCIVVAPGANADLEPEDLEKHSELIRSAGMVLLQLEIPLQTVQTACAIAKAAGVPVMLDPAPAAALPASLLRQISWLTPNESEARPVLGEACSIGDSDDVRRTAEELLERGVANVVVKMGSRGSYVATADGSRDAVPAVSVEAIDSTAAGDAFNAAFAVALMRGSSPLNAAHFASAAAAISVSREGAQPSMPYGDEVEAVLKAKRV